jgi:hypothetical protein
MRNRLGRRRRGRLFRKEEPARVGVVIEQLRVAAPPDGRFELRLGFLLAEVFIEQVFEYSIRQGMVGAGFERPAVRNSSFRRRMSASANARPAAVISTSPSSSLANPNSTAPSTTGNKSSISNDRAAASRYISSRPLWSASISSRPAIAPRRACGSI